MHLVVTPPKSGMKRQKMVKSGNWSPAFEAGYQLVTGWVSDGTYPCSISANKMVVSGGGPASVEVSFTTSSSVDGLNSWTLFRNETIVGNVTRSSGTTATATFTVTLVAGDLLSLRINAGSSGTLTAAYIDVSAA